MDISRLGLATVTLCFLRELQRYGIVRQRNGLALLRAVVGDRYRVPNYVTGT